MLFSCGSDPCDQCQSENEQLKAEKVRQDSILNSFSKAYSEIDSTSLIIEGKKSKINEMAQKGRLTEEDKIIILAEMDTINTLLENNKSRVSDLQGDVDGGLQEGFRYMVKSMDEKNSAEDLGLDEMKQDLAQISRDFSELFEDYVYKEVENMEMREKLSSTAKELEDAQQKLDQAKEKLRSGWYVIGEKEELKEKGLIYNKGFFDNKEVNEDFDKSQFRKVNIYELKEIILDARKADIVTTHPTESYEFVGIKKKVNKLVITNPELFWSVSKFLIIEIDR